MRRQSEGLVKGRLEKAIRYFRFLRLDRCPAGQGCTIRATRANGLASPPPLDLTGAQSSTIVRPMNGLNRICGICREIIG
jgi:hypothetical protein